ncbi:hypothetical protein KEG38_26930 [Polyangium jinanense]|uniref:hypothetical protein n=1 Tax=Polyangium jinanense TaxID=2829994 RepID=UPI0023412A60|nr:hypothetical protein [Polyangium jinanense]MDC3957522.1 hypothetical protein [Polyangium jinanense]
MMTSGSLPLALSALVLGMSACILGDVEPSPVETSVATTTQPVVVAPDPADKRYVNTFQKLDPTRTDFNWQKWPNGTREVQIAGKLIVLDDAYVNSMGKDIQAGNVTRLDIYAERLIVRRPIRVPGAHVRIYARELRFEDTGAEPALIDTSAKQPPVGAEQFRNGDNGQSAGDVHLFVKEFSSQGNRFPRFRMNGGNGQNAGPGKHGAPGVSQTTFASAHQDLLKCARKHGIAASMNFHVSSFKFDPAPLTLDELENNAVALGVDLPTSGTNASPGGRPGEPGNAGSLHANLPGLAPYAEMLGGSAGLSAGYYRGGRAGQPTPALKLASAKCQHLVGFSTPACRGCGGSTSTADRLIVPSVTRATPTDGRSVDSPLPNRSTGDAGEAELVNAPFAWLHPHSVAMTLSFVEDAFLNGFRTLAVDELTSLDQALDTYQKSPDWQALALGDQALLEQQELRVETLLGKLAARQDYFGNPEHWVPALSLEANKLLFEEEVRWAIRTIYMADWITETQERQVDRAAAIDAAKNLLRQEIRTLESQYNDALLALPQLQIDAETAASHLATLEGELLVAEQRLEARARENVEDRHKVPFWKKGLRVLASVARLIPVGQPYTGAIAGTALDAIAEVKSDAPWDSIKALPDQVKQASETIDKAKEAAAAAKKAKEEKVKPETKKTKKTLREGVKELATKLSPVIEEAKKHKALFASAEAPKEELEKELEKLKGEDAAFKKVAEKAAAITKEREAFAARLTETLDKLENAAGKMGEHYLHLAELLPEEEGITEVLLTQRAMLAIGDMRQGGAAAAQVPLPARALVRVHHAASVPGRPDAHPAVQRGAFAGEERRHRRDLDRAGRAAVHALPRRDLVAGRARRDRARRPAADHPGRDRPHPRRDRAHQRGIAARDRLRRARRVRSRRGEPAPAGPGGRRPTLRRRAAGRRELHGPGVRTRRAVAHLPRGRGARIQALQPEDARPAALDGTLAERNAHHAPAEPRRRVAPACAAHRRRRKPHALRPALAVGEVLGAHRVPGRACAPLGGAPAPLVRVRADRRFEQLEGAPAGAERAHRRPLRQSAAPPADRGRAARRPRAARPRLRRWGRGVRGFPPA